MGASAAAQADRSRRRRVPASSARRGVIGRRTRRGWSVGARQVATAARSTRTARCGSSVASRRAAPCRRTRPGPRRGPRRAARPRTRARRGRAWVRPLKREGQGGVLGAGAEFAVTCDSPRSARGWPSWVPFSLGWVRRGRRAAHSPRDIIVRSGRLVLRIGVTARYRGLGDGPAGAVSFSRRRWSAPGWWAPPTIRDHRRLRGPPASRRVGSAHHPGPSKTVGGAHPTRTAAHSKPPPPPPPPPPP